MPWVDKCIKYENDHSNNHHNNNNNNNKDKN